MQIHTTKGYSYITIIADKPVFALHSRSHSFLYHPHRQGPVLRLIADDVLAIQDLADHATVHGGVVHLRETIYK